MSRPPKLITSAANPLIKDLRALQEKKHRERAGVFLAEGMRVVLEAVDAGAVLKTLVFASQAADHAVVRRLINAAHAQNADIIETTPDILTKLTRKDNPQSVVGVFAAQDHSLDDLDPKTSPLWFALEGLKDPGNLGTILRLADAVGAGGVILLDQSCDPFSVEAVRASMGAVFLIPVARASGPAFFAWSQRHGMQVAAATLQDAQDFRAAAYQAPAVLLMGNEQSGLPPAYQQAADLRVKIPMHGKADSLNVALATAVIAYEMRRRLG
jgi:RNA methyltransferase, TrmH family